jgi:ketosteroid isomerase-like protein
MSRHGFVAIAALCAVAPLCAQTPSPIERDLIKLENDWSMAWQKKDAAFLQKLFADEYLDTDQDGATFTKPQELANVPAAAFTLTSFALSDLKVHVYGVAAVVTGRNTIKGLWKGKDASGAYRFTDVFVKRDGRWQAVATHGSRVAGP